MFFFLKGRYGVIIRRRSAVIRGYGQNPGLDRARRRRLIRCPQSEVATSNCGGFMWRGQCIRAFIID
jgi:hypothetical protein